MPTYDESSTSKTYSGIVGFGLQIMMTASLLGVHVFAGVEALWFAFTNNNNFGNGIIPWVYIFNGASMGFVLDIDKLLSTDIINNPKNVLAKLGLGFGMSLDKTFFLITANKMTHPDDYTGKFQFSTYTLMGVTVSKAWGSKISTYGVGLSWDVSVSIKKGISIGKSWLVRLVECHFIELYRLIKMQKNYTI